MAVAFASATQNSQGGDSDITVTKPTGLASGDMLVAFCIRDVDGFDTPSGWTLLGEGGIITSFAKVADSGDAAASNFTFSPAGTSGDTSIVMLVRLTGTFTGGVANLVIDAQGTDASTGGENLASFSGLTPVANNSVLLMAGAIQEGTDVAFSGYATANNNPSWTEQYDLSSTDSGINIEFALAYATYASTGATGNFSFTPDTNGTYSGFLVSISESTNVTVNATPLIATGTIPNASISGDANVTATPLIATGTLPNATIDAQQNTVWTNEDGPPDTTWTFENL